MAQLTLLPMVKGRIYQNIYVLVIILILSKSKPKKEILEPMKPLSIPHLMDLSS